MRRFASHTIALAILTTTVQAQQEIDNVAAFARMYGVARWFYPSDAAAGLDWNRFAVHGVSRVRTARTPAERVVHGCRSRCASWASSWWLPRAATRTSRWDRS